MSPVQIRPAQAADELLTFNRKLGEGLQNLVKIGPIDAGVTLPNGVCHQEPS